eukprot:jgi/Botrbrau1/8972/Bobra.0148s0080.2
MLQTARRNAARLLGSKFSRPASDQVSMEGSNGTWADGSLGTVQPTLPTSDWSKQPSDLQVPQRTPYPVPTLEIHWREADLATFDIPDLRGLCNLIVISAGSFHHLVKQADQVGCLNGIRKHLRGWQADAEGGGPGLAVVDIFDSQELLQESPAALEVGPFRREELRREIAVCEDGGQLVHSFFRLWYDPQALTEASAEEPAGVARDATGECLKLRQGSGQPEAFQVGGPRGTLEQGPLQGTESPPRGDRQGCKTRFVDEDWCLRSVRAEEFRRLAIEAGLRIVAEYNSFSEGLTHLFSEAPADDGTAPTLEEKGGRVFVLGLP